MNIKYLFLIFLFPLISIPATNKAQPNFTGNWKLVGFKNLITGEEIADFPIDSAVTVWITLNTKNDTGTIRGIACNKTFEGTYILFEDGKMKVTSFTGERIMEHCWGSQKFWNAVTDISSYRYTRKNYFALYLLYDNDTKEMKFEVHSVYRPQ